MRGLAKLKSWLAGLTKRLDTALDAASARLASLCAGPAFAADRLWRVRAPLLSVGLGAWLVTLDQVADFFADDRMSAAASAGFCATVLLLWCIPVHYAARIALDAAPPRQCEKAVRGWRSFLDLTLPRILGGVPLAIITVSGLMIAAEAREAGTPAAAVAATRVDWLVAISMATLAVYGVYVWYRRILLTKERTRKADKRRSAADVLLGIAPWTYVLVPAALLAVSIAAPVLAAENISRLLLLPVILAGWLPVVGYLSVFADRVRLPVVAGLILAIAVIGTLANPRTHDVRTVSMPPDEPKASRQSGTREAVDHWKRANGCAEAGTRCPRPVIVAAEGGASRAAFQTATVLGELFDVRASTPNGRDHKTAVFAMSGVSGGALGVGAARVALQESQRRQISARQGQSHGPATPPCVADGTGKALLAPDPRLTSWRACLQLLVSGDYLTPAVIGLAFRDWVLKLLPVDGEDRAALLEIAMERHFAMVTRGATEADCSRGAGSGLCARFGYLAHGSDAPWLPLLFLNATTVRSGRHILVSDVSPAEPSVTHDRVRYRKLLPSAFDAFAVMNETRKEPGDRPKGCKPTPERDLRMSTAIVMSARFPIISSEGALADRCGQAVADVVDGGYFDNGGLITARALALELRSLDLEPVILRISNDPVSQRGPTGAPENGPYLDLSEPDWWDSIWKSTRSPLDALLGARQGHSEAEYIRAYEAVSRSGHGDAQLIADLRVYLEILPRHGDGKAGPERDCPRLPQGGASAKRVSMDWWLSPMVREFLDLQSCGWQNAGEMTRLTALIANDQQATPPGTKAPQSATVQSK